MNAPPKPWWRRRRFYYPALVAALLLLALAVAIARSDTSQIIVYNQTGSAFGPLTITACGQSHTFPRMDDETSVRFRLAKSGSESEIGLSAEYPQPLRWQFGYIESHGGYYAIIHLRPGLEPELHTQISFWRQWLTGAPN